MSLPDQPFDTVCLLDVDNTLLDNDRFQDELDARVERDFGAQGRDLYRSILERRRAELGYVDYLGAMQEFRLAEPDHAAWPSMSAWLLDYPFAALVYPGAFDAIASLDGLGPTVILSDGDIIFQPRKIELSGLWQAVAGRVLIYVHKEQMLDTVARRYPARRYLMVDDKLRILDEMKRRWGERLTTVFVRQGHYARDAAAIARLAPADVSVECIADLAALDLTAFNAQEVVK
jgi:FMN phosphatase YigB (HAD superfamily)